MRPIYSLRNGSSSAPPRGAVPRVAVIGSGISGLATAHALTGKSSLTLFEAERRFGGHSHTVDVRLQGIRHGVDTGFLVFNERTYPRLIELFASLGVVSAASDMSFSVQAPAQGIEWSGSSLNSVFAQRRNLLRPRFIGMLREILRFNGLASAMAEGREPMAVCESIGGFLERRRFGSAFREWYLLPMLGCIWSCPTARMLEFPVATMVRFCHNHGLLQIAARPQWRSVVGGSRNYVAKMLAGIDDARRGCAVRSVRRTPAGVVVATDQGQSLFDEVVLACHSDQALELLADADGDERAVLGAVRWQRNRAVLHTDAALLPRRRRAWAAWNYERAADSESGGSPVCLHYLINRLQPLPWHTPVLVSLNPCREPAPRSVVGEYEYRHPVFDAGAIAAQQRLPSIQGRTGVWFCGAWTRYGFHEDGLLSALNVSAALQARWRHSDVAAQRRAA